MPENSLFAGDSGSVSKINYSVPLPSSHTGRKILQLELGLKNEDFLESARVSAESFRQKTNLHRDSEGQPYSFDLDAVTYEWLRVAKLNGISTLAINSVKQFYLDNQEALSKDKNIYNKIEILKKSSKVLREASSSSNIIFNRSGIANYNVAVHSAHYDVGTKLRNDYLEGIEKLHFEGELSVSSANPGGDTHTTPYNPTAVEIPELFLIEIYGISSFLGDYGMGKTVKTFTLLPGETTTIYLRTWKATNQSYTEASSIVDSQTTSSAEKFSSAVQNETTDKATQSAEHNWHAEANVQAGWGWGKADVKGGGGGKYHTSREEFAKDVMNTVKEHAAEASSKRENSISSSSEISESAEQESVIERTIKNTNMRRVLNFVFRELNQEYITKVHLKEVKIGFTNGQLNSWKETPLSGLYGFLQSIIVPEKVDGVVQDILKTVGTAFDINDDPVITLERLEMSDDQSEWEKSDAQLNEHGVYDPKPSDNVFYRYKRGALNQNGEAHPVEGVVLKRDKVTLRTDSVIVEALLGEVDALDEYAMRIQKASAEEREIKNDNHKILKEVILSLKDDKAKIELLLKLLNPKQE